MKCRPIWTLLFITVYSRFDQCVCIERGKEKQPIRGVIFDLDDTLYSEKDYVRSGYRAVADYLGDENAAEKLWEYFEQGIPAIDAYLEETKQMDQKAELVRSSGNSMRHTTSGKGVRTHERP